MARISSENLDRLAEIVRDLGYTVEHITFDNVYPESPMLMIRMAPMQEEENCGSDTE